MCSPRKISPTCALPARFASPRATRARNPRGDEERTAKPRSREEEFTADFTYRADLLSTGFWLLATGFWLLLLDSWLLLPVLSARRRASGEFADRSPRLLYRLLTGGGAVYGA